MQALETIEVIHNPNNLPIDAAVIWLHGLGSSGHDFEPIVPSLGLHDDMGIRFIFPHAPAIPVTINGGAIMPAWYDILQINLEREIDTDQIDASANRVAELIKHQNRQGIASKRIILAGFSQGGALAYHLGLSYPDTLAGIMALSTYLATKETINYTSANQKTPVKIDHGVQDPVVPVQLGQMANDYLTHKGYPTDYRTYTMGHQVCLSQIRDIGEWINQLLN